MLLQIPILVFAPLERMRFAQAYEYLNMCIECASLIHCLDHINPNIDEETVFFFRIFSNFLASVFLHIISARNSSNSMGQTE